MRENLRLVLLAIGIRLMFAPFSMHPVDMSTLYETAKIVVEGGNIYRYVLERTREIQSATGLPLFYEGYAYHPVLIGVYVPFYILFTYLNGPFQVLINGHYPGGPILVYPGVFLLLLLLKMPSIIADAAITYTLSRIDLRKASFYALSPYAVLISSVWGMFDSVVAVFLLLAYLYERKAFISGLCYGLSLVKLYTVLVAPLYLMRHLKAPRRLVAFGAGFMLTMIPLLPYSLQDFESLWGVLVGFHAIRAMGGVNPYNAIWIIGDVHFVLEVSQVPNVALLISLALFLLTFGRKLPLLEAILAIMFLYFILGKVVNEQFLLSILPLILLSDKCDRKLWIFPTLFMFIRSAPFEFIQPLFFINPDYYQYYLELTAVWKKIAGLGYTHVLMYSIGLIFSLILLRNLLNIMEPAQQAVREELRRVGQRSVSMLRSFFMRLR